MLVSTENAIASRLRRPTAVAARAVGEEGGQLRATSEGFDQINALSAEPCRPIDTSVPSVVAVRKDENPELSTEVKGTLEKASRSVRAMTSVLAGPRGTLSVAKSPSARLARREAPAPEEEAVMPVCNEEEDQLRLCAQARRRRTAICSMSNGKAKGNWNVATVLSVEKAGAQGCCSVKKSDNELSVMLLITCRFCAAGWRRAWKEVSNG